MLDPLPATAELPVDAVAPDVLVAEEPDDEDEVKTDFGEADFESEDPVDDAAEETDPVEAGIVPGEPPPSWTASCVGEEISSEVTHVSSCILD